MERLGKFLGTFLFVTLLLGVYGIAEEITLTTYYPAPYGNYEELQASKLAIGSGTTMPTVDGSVNIATTGTDTGGILQVGGTTDASCGIYIETHSTGSSEGWGLIAMQSSVGTGTAIYGCTMSFSTYSNAVVGLAGADGVGIRGVGGNPATSYAGYFSGGKGVKVEGNLEVTGNLEVAGDMNITGDIYKGGVLYRQPPDYVFEPGYSLMSLPQLKGYVLEHKHLPNLPSAEDVKKYGVKIFEQNRLLLEKLEEAYLHIFELESRISKLESMVQKER